MRLESAFEQAGIRFLDIEASGRIGVGFPFLVESGKYRKSPCRDVGLADRVSIAISW
jgi:hypothetical protein